jgi:hypothetical protein
MIEFDTSAFESEFRSALAQLEEGVGEDALRTIGFAGADIFRDEAKRNAARHAKTWTIHNNIIVKRVEEESNGNTRQVYIVTVRAGGYGGSDAFYWKWVEAGHKFVPENTRIGKRGRKVGWKIHRAIAALEYGTSTVPAYPFMRPAYESKKQEAVDVMTQKLVELLLRNARQ